MDIYQLKTFVAAAESKSFSKCASQIHLTRMAVKRHIDALESELGFSLFVRSQQGVTLTEAGERFLSTASKTLEMLDGAIDEIQKVASMKILRFSPPSPLTMPSHVLSQALKEYAKLYPSVKVEMLNSKPMDNIKMLQEDKMDAGYYTDSEILCKSGLHFAPYGILEICCVLSESHPLSGQKALQPENLAGELCGLRSDYYCRLWSELIRHGVNCREIRGFSLIIPQMIEFIQQGGIMVLSEMRQKVLPFPRIPLIFRSKPPIGGFICRPNDPKHVQDFVKIMALSNKKQALEENSCTLYY